MTQLTLNEDGSITFPVHLNAEQVQILLYKHYKIDENIFDEIETISVGAAYAQLLVKAKSFYEEEYRAGGNDGSIFLNDNSVVEYYMNHPDTETAKEEADRIALEATNLVAEKERLESEKDKALADLET